MGEYMGIQWSVYTTTTIIMMKSIFFAALVAAVAAEAAPEADADAYYGAYGYSGLTNYGYGLNRLSYGGAYGLGLRSYAAAPAYTGYSAYTGYGNLYGAGYGARYLGKRSADAEPEAEAEADAYYGNLGYGYAGLNNYAVRSYAAAPVAAVRSYAAAPIAAAPLATRSYAAVAPAYTGYTGLGARYLHKRSADAEPEADAYYGNAYGYNTLGYGYSGLNNYAAVRSYAAAPIAAVRSYAAAPIAAVRSYAAPAYTTGYGLW